ncbi:hypothetical protein [Bradyrhizobium sp. CCBAU 51753]|uniref:hypothetical protein n=1 Tax=Bradyrhizobium sp. CCBAU 51753 TaxID=1325100 RepID=UPI00188AF6FB|nr:hypothetical protein [Bradyrhizobium sp. CCBAU 51753]QOZ25285.1 hypothetical protein XH93_18075 [Bradyrhizobium sp. CCBAU 51753]
MADWYVSSTAYALVATFQTSHAYALNDIVRPTSPSATNKYSYKCTTAGTSGGSEPSWTTTKGNTTTSGTATFTLVDAAGTTLNWTAPVGNLASITNGSGGLNMQASTGDRIFISSDHTETNVISTYRAGISGTGQVIVLSVNKNGSVPPVPADLTSGASISCAGGGSDLSIDPACDSYWYGITFTAASGRNIKFNNGGHRGQYFKNCSFVMAGSSGNFAPDGQGQVTLDNSTITFSNSSQSINFNGTCDLRWINTPSALGGSTFPTTLFNNNSFNNGGGLATLRGVDISSVTGTLVAAINGQYIPKMLFDSCKVSASATRFPAAGSNTVATADEVEFVNCYDGSNIISERYTQAGKVTTDLTTYLTGGAADDVGGFSQKMVSNAFSDLLGFPLEGFWFDVENTAVGSSKTATVEIVSSASLNNTDIRLVLEYQGTSGSSLASFADSLATPLTASAALTTSTATWNSPPSTPVYQKLQVTFTPQVAGRVRGRVLLGKASATVWVNPQISIA